MANILVLLADGFEEIEGLTVVDILRRLKQNVVTAAIADVNPVHGSHKIDIVADKMLKDINPDEFDCVVLPGGLPGTTNLGASERVLDIIKDFHQKGKYICAICAAPTVFAKLGLLKGEHATVNPGFNDILIEAGADFTEDRVAVSNKIITSRSMGTAIEFALEIGKVFAGETAAKDLKETILA